MRRLCVVWFVFAVVAPLARAEAEVAVEVEIRSPASGIALFDEVAFEIDVHSDASVIRLEVRLDGELIATRPESPEQPLGAPPFELTIDVGAENRDRRLEVVAITQDGRQGRAELVAPKISVDDEVDLELQQLFVTVTDRKDVPILDLDSAAFTVFDDGVRQRLVTVAAGDIPFSATLLIDGSHSMRGRPLAAALAGAGRFLRDLGEHDEARILVHSDRLLGVTLWGGRDDHVDQALRGVEAAGGTAVLDHLFLALLDAESRLGRRTIVLLTDGWDLHSVLPADTVLQAARRSQAIVYWVRPAGRIPGEARNSDGSAADNRSVPLSAWRDELASVHIFETLEAVVVQSGGRILVPASVDEAGDAFAEILAELRAQYALGYYPDPRRDDGSWRAVEVEVDRRRTKVRTRGGYLDF